MYDYQYTQTQYYSYSILDKLRELLNFNNENNQFEEPHICITVDGKYYIRKYNKIDNKYYYLSNNFSMYHWNSLPFKTLLFDKYEKAIDALKLSLDNFAIAFASDIE